MLLFLSSG